MYKPLIESHVGAWEVAIVLLLVGYILYRLDKQKAAKVIQMILRLLYVVIVGSGLWMLFQFHSSDPLYYLKGLLGIATIALAEIALKRAAHRHPSLSYLVAALVLFVVVILIGYRVIV